jgi:hypothetical protein
LENIQNFGTMQILKRPTQVTFLEKISFLGIIVSAKILKELLGQNEISF